MGELSDARFEMQDSQRNRHPACGHSRDGCVTLVLRPAEAGLVKAALKLPHSRGLCCHTTQNRTQSKQQNVGCWTLESVTVEQASCLSSQPGRLCHTGAPSR
jgi:hypothetical protein